MHYLSWTLLLLATSAWAAPLPTAERQALLETWVVRCRRAFPEVPGASPAMLQGWLREGRRVVVVDVRPAAERQVAMLPGALTAAQFEARRERYSRHRVVVYCTVGWRSARQAAAWRRTGLAAWNLEGSVMGWLWAGGEVVDGTGQVTHRVHAYGAQYACQPDGYEAVW